MGPYNPAQPIPYIADLSITGVLRIGWDRSMTERDDYESINPSRVAVRDSTDIVKAEAQTSSEVDLASAVVLDSSGGFRNRRQLNYRHEGFYMNDTTY